VPGKTLTIFKEKKKQALAELATVTKNRLSNPNRIPERIIEYLFNQTGSQGVGNHVSGHLSQMFFCPQGMIVKRLLPERPLFTHEAIDLTTAGRFEPVDHGTQALLFTHLHQPVDMIRHEHPGKHAGIAEQGVVLEAAAGGAGGPEIEKHRLALPGGRGHQIDLVGQGNPAFAQGVMSRIVVAVHHFIYPISFWFFAGMARSYSAWRYRGL
jgi:hypothetical protein